MKITLAQWLADIEALHPAEIELGLERIQFVYQRLPQLSPRTRIYTVAGTNGKGSTVKSIEALALALGKRVGVYMSPHLLVYNERVQIQQQNVSDEQLVQAFEQVEAARGDIGLTYFEFGTLAALVIFAEAALDWVVLEVGLGGRLDAVNIVDPDVAVITSIDLDHESWLGDTREKIGSEKAGIVRASSIMVCGDTDAPQSLVEKGRQARASYWRGREFDVQGNQLTFTDPGSDDAGKPAAACSVHIPPDLPVMADNFATAIQAVAASGEQLSESVITQAAKNVRLQGRQQLIQEKPWVMLDVGHNPQAARALAEKVQQLRSRHSLRRVYCLVGMLADKNHRASLAALMPVVDEWWPVTLDVGYRAGSAQQLVELLQEGGALVNDMKDADKQADSPQGAYARLRPRLAPDDLLVVFGSFHTVADVLSST